MKTRLPLSHFSGNIDDWLLASSLFSCILLLARIAITGSGAYIFLPWNLFLAFIPYWISSWINVPGSEVKSKLKTVAGLAAWLLFIPNSFYIITDLFHFTRIRSAPKWFDLLMIFSFAWNGIVCGIISLRRIELLLTKWLGKGYSLTLILIVMWMSGFGIYIGRYLRFSSWDIVTSPILLGEEMLYMIVHPFRNLYSWGMIGCYSVFMTLLYFTIKRLGMLFIAMR